MPNLTPGTPVPSVRNPTSAVPSVKSPIVSSGTIRVLPVPGPAGPPGGAAYTYRQAAPSASWTVSHALGRIVEPVLLLDDYPQVPVHTDMYYPDLNTTVIVFPTPVTGWAHF